MRDSEMSSRGSSYRGRGRAEEKSCISSRPAFNWIVDHERGSLWHRIGRAEGLSRPLLELVLNLRLMERRNFLKKAATAAALAGWKGADAQNALLTLHGAAAHTPLPVVSTVNGIGRRKLGRTETEVSIIGIGGYHLGGKQVTEKDAIQIIRTALEEGINFLDNCWDYNGGVSEERMGKALQDGYRQKAFLMTKIDGRTGVAARQQLETSMQRLKTDAIDLVQIHEVIRMTDPELAFRPGHVIDVLQQARTEGKIRFIGFTGHKSPEMHLNMLATAEKHGFHFDTVQMPVNALDYHFDSFGQRVIPVAQKSGIAVIGMKPLSNAAILKTNTIAAPEALHYAMSVPVTLTITGCESLANLEQALAVARNFKPLNIEQKIAILKRTAPFAHEAKFEDYKSSHIYDGTFNNPQWLG
jgi:predicted aldo/keto reductase-like oxidoreductase